MSTIPPSEDGSSTFLQNVDIHLLTLTLKMEAVCMIITPMKT
jgi:hypothetical protein